MRRGLSRPPRRSPRGSQAPKAPGASAQLSALSDLCTPWCIRVVATLRIADHIAAGTTDIKTLAEEAGCDPDSLLRGARASGGQGRLSGALARSVRAQ